MTIKRTGETRANQAGMASIITVVILLTILALITTGFSQLMRREVRQSLDKQLSTEAYFAAESGLNDIRAYLNSGSAVPFPGCQPPSTPAQLLTNGDISGDGNVKYSCISLDTTPSDLFFNLQPGESKIFSLTPANIDKLYFSWQSANSGPPQALGALGTLPVETSIGNAQTGVLRVAIYPVPAGSTSGGADSNALLNTASRNYFLYPNAGNGQLNCGGANSACVDYTNAAADGAFVSGQCNSSTYPGPGTLPYQAAAKRFCNSEVKNLRTQGIIYDVRITALYSPLIGAMQVADNSNTLIKIPGNQGVIDATGTGSDVSQRVRAIISSTPQYNSPVNAIWSMEAVCKLFRVPVNGLGLYGSPIADSNMPSADSSCGDSVPINSGGQVDGGGIAPLPVPPQCPSPPGPGPCGPTVGTWSGGLLKRISNTAGTITLTWSWPTISGGSPPDSVTGCQIENISGGPLGVGPSGGPTTFGWSGTATVLRCFSANGGVTTVSQS